MQPVCNSFLLFRDSDFLTFKISIFSALHNLHPFFKHIHLYIYYWNHTLACSGWCWARRKARWSSWGWAASLPPAARSACRPARSRDPPENELSPTSARTSSARPAKSWKNFCNVEQIFLNSFTVTMHFWAESFC